MEASAHRGLVCGHIRGATDVVVALRRTTMMMMMMCVMCNEQTTMDRYESDKKSHFLKIAVCDTGNDNESLTSPLI